MEDTLDLRDYLAVIRRRAWLIIVVTLVVTGTAVGVSLTQTPQYEGVTEVVIEPVRRSDDVAALEDLVLGSSIVETEERILTSRAVTERVIADLELDIDPTDLADQVRTGVLRDTRVVTLTVTDDDPVFAASVANGYADAYFTIRRERAIDELLAAQDELDRRAEQIQSQISEIEGQIAVAGDGDVSSLESERQGLIAQLSQIRAQRAGTGAADTSEQVRGGGQVLEPAIAATSPVSPQPLRTGILGLVLGLMLGVGMAFLRDHLDDTLRGEEDARTLPGAPAVVGRIPHHKDDQGRIVTLISPNATIAEAYRGLGANVRFLLAPSLAATDQPSDGPPQGRLPAVVFVTSAQAAEGKTCTATNLAVVTARAGRSTIVIDADLRRPTIAGRLGLGRVAGLSELLAGGVNVNDVAIPVDDNLVAITSGAIPPNPAELLSSPAWPALLAELAKSGTEVVIVDTSPVLAVPDALEVARSATFGLVVAMPGRSSRRATSAGIERLLGVGAKVGGVVLNDLANRAEKYEYVEYYAYGDRPDTPEADAAPAPLPIGVDLRASRKEASGPTPPGSTPTSGDTASVRSDAPTTPPGGTR